MVAVSEIVIGIEQKVWLLVNKLAALERDNAELTEKNQALLEHNRTLQADLLLTKSEISQLTQQAKTQNGEEEESKEARERKHHLRKEIDQYIVEIDQCIEWLQNS